MNVALLQLCNAIGVQILTDHASIDFSCILIPFSGDVLFTPLMSESFDFYYLVIPGHNQVVP